MARRLDAQLLAFLVGALFVVVGLLGFVPGIVTGYGDLELAGRDSGTELLGVFDVSVLHNLVHVVAGIAGLAAAYDAVWALTYLVGGGAVYVALWIYGLAIDLGGDANFVPVDEADNWLHFGLGVAMIGAGLLAGRARATA